MDVSDINSIIIAKNKNANNPFVISIIPSLCISHANVSGNKAIKHMTIPENIHNNVYFRLILFFLNK
jgi:hypothetical protein